MNILFLNCQKNYHPKLKKFLQKTIESEQYNFLLLQEATDDVLAHIHSYSHIGITTVSQNDRPGLMCVVYNTRLTMKGTPNVRQQF